jgi:hypothetical protein
MNNLQSLLDGKKTYAISLVAVLSGVIQLIQGDKFLQVLPYLLAGVFGASVRAAIAKIDAKIEARLPAPVDKVINAVLSDAESGDLPKIS